MYRLLFLLPLLVVALFPDSAAAQLVTCDGVSAAGQRCGTCEFAQMVKNVFGFLITLASIIATITLVYVGIRLNTSGGNEQVKGEVKQALWNIVIGLFFIIAAFAIVDAIMRALVTDGSLLNWDQLECIYAVNPTDHRVDIETPDIVYELADGTYTTDVSAAISGDCSVDAYTAAGVPASIAPTFSCIAQAESGCVLNASNPRSSAYGALQILRGYDNPCHNLNQPACSEAVGVTGDLNCSRAFGSGGRVIAGQEDLAALCNQAASNFECNTQAGYCLYQRDGNSFSAWTGHPTHTAQQACVSRYGS